MTSGLAGTYLLIRGDPNAQRLLDEAYRLGPFGQTQNSPVAHAIVWGSLGVATAATTLAVCANAAMWIIRGRMATLEQAIARRQALAQNAADHGMPAEALAHAQEALRLARLLRELWNAFGGGP